MDEPVTISTEGDLPRSSLLSRLLNVFAAPGDVFEEVRHSPNSAANWLVPAVVYVLVGWLCVGFIFSQPAIRQQVSDITSRSIEKQIAARNPPKAQADQMRMVGEKYGAIMMTGSMIVMPVLGGFLLPFWDALIIWLGGRFVFKGKVGYMKTVEVAGLSNMIGGLDTVLRSLLVVIMGSIFVTPSLVLLVKNFNPENTLHALFAIVNVMTIWQLGVQSIGLAKLSGASMAKSLAWIFGVWIAYRALFVGFGMVMRSLMHSATGG